MSIETFPALWQVALSAGPNDPPVRVGDHVIVADGRTLRAFARVDGTPAWTHIFAGKLSALVAAGDACVTVSWGGDRDRIACFGADGTRRWELDERWNMTSRGVTVAGDRFVIAGAHLDPDRARALTLRERRVSNGALLRELKAAPRSTILAIPGGWAWTDHGLHVLDAQGVRVLGADPAYTIAACGTRIYAMGDDLRLRAYDVDRGLVWDRPGGSTSGLAVDEDSVVCARREPEGLWLCCYDAAGDERWRTGPFMRGSPSLQFWGDHVIASGVSHGGETLSVMLARADGRLIVREPGSWASPSGGPTLDGDSFYTTFRGVLRRRQLRTWARIEDAWPPVYLREVCIQLDRGLGGKLDDKRKRLRAAATAKQFDAGEARDAVAAVRQDRAGVDRERNPIAWLYRTADWPLMVPARINDPDVPTIEPITPDGRVELICFDDLCDYPVWADRAKLVQYPNVRYLSMRLSRLDGGPIGIKLWAFPQLEYLDLAENVLARVPPEVRDCRALIYLDLSKNRLETLAAEDLPASLRFLDLGGNPIAPDAVARVRAARPGCHIEHHPG